MRPNRFAELFVLALVVFGVVSSSTRAQVGGTVTFSTLVSTPLVIEGLTGDNIGNLYTVGRNAGAGAPCPVWRVTIANPTLVVVGFIPAPSPTAQCSPSGLAFNNRRVLFVADADKVFSLIPNASTPPTATVFASGVPGTNGLAFDRNGNLWTGDGTTGQGRVWKISPAGSMTEVFRVQPMANEVNLVGTPGVGGVGRDVRTLPPGTITVTPTSRNAANTEGSQPLVANGLAFDHDGNLLIADTARGAIWRVRFDRRGNLRSRTGCDNMFTPNTLCLDAILVAHPLLEGVDGIVLDEDGNIWAAANERNAVVFFGSEERNQAHSSAGGDSARQTPMATAETTPLMPRERSNQPDLTEERSHARKDHMHGPACGPSWDALTRALTGKGPHPRPARCSSTP